MESSPEVIRRLHECHAGQATEKDRKWGGHAMSAVRKLSQRENLLLDVRIAAHYHHRRRSFLEGFDRMAKAIAIIGGSVALSRLFGGNEIAVSIAGVVV